MPKYIGREDNAGLGKETTYGVAVDPTSWVAFTDFNIADQNVTITDNSAVGTRDDILSTDTDYTFAEGNLNGVIHDRTFGHVLLAAFGSVSSAADEDASGVYNHTFAFANTLPSYTIANKNPNEEKRFAGALANSLEIAAAAGGYATYTSAWLGRKGEDGSNTPSHVEQHRFRPQDVKLYVADSVADLDSADKECITEFTFTLNNNISTNACLGSETPDFDPGVRNLTLTLNKPFNNTTMKDMVMGTAKKAFRIEMIRADKSIGTGTPTNPKLVIDFEPGLFSTWSREGGLDDIQTEAIEFQPLRSFSAAKTLTATLTNMEESY